MNTHGGDAQKTEMHPRDAAAIQATARLTRLFPRLISLCDGSVSNRWIDRYVHTRTPAWIRRENDNKKGKNDRKRSIWLSTRTNEKWGGGVKESGSLLKTAQAGVPIHFLSGGVWLHKDNAGCANKSISDLPTSLTLHPDVYLSMFVGCLGSIALELL